MLSPETEVAPVSTNFGIDSYRTWGHVSCYATDSISHQLRGALKKENWSVTETRHEVLLTPPGVTLALPEPVNGGDEELLEAEFTLEYQLQDFLAQNLEAISVEGKKLRLYVDPTDHRQGETGARDDYGQDHK